MPKRFALVVVITLAAVCAQAAQPRLKWSYDTHGKIYSSPIIVDLDGDGKKEVLVCASRDRRIICFDGSGEVRWQYQLIGDNTDGIQATPSAVDYDGDGHKEVFFADENGVVGCLDHRGKLIWRTFTGDRIDYSAPVVADVNGDGRVEVLFGTVSGTLYCLDDAGMELWHYQGDGPIYGIPAVLPDKATATMRIYVTFANGKAACLSSEGKLLWSRDEPSPTGARRCGPALGDLDGDGRVEVVTATADFHVIASDALTGDERWRWKGLLGIDQTNSFALADFDGSGKLDIVCGDGAGLGGPGHVYRLRDGKALWTADVRGGVVQGPSIGDVDGDGELEILVGTRENRLVCLSADGKEKWSYPCGAGAITTPAIGDVDGDGKTDVVFTSKDGLVRCLTVGGTYHPDRMPWPGISHDAQLSGYMKGATFTTTKAARPARLLEALHIAGFGPLRTGANRVAISIVNRDYRPRHLEAVARIIGPGGRASTQEVSFRVAPYARLADTLAFDALEAGVYTLTVRLLDAGTGSVISTATRRTSFAALGWETQAIRKRLAQGSRLVGALKDENLKRRASAAIGAQQAAFARFERAVAPARAVGHRAELGLAPRVGGKDDRRRAAASVASEGGSRRSLRYLAATARGILRECDRIAARLNAASVTPSPTLDFAVAPVTTLRKVFRDEPCYTGAARPARAAVSLAGNEYEGVQLVLVPLWRSVRGLRVSVTDAVQSGGHARIPARDIAVNRVGYIKIGPPEYNWRVEKLGYYPDVLLPPDAADIPAEQDAQPYFVTVHAQNSTPPGDYKSAVTFRADGSSPVTVPLAIHVWRFALADETHLKASMWMSEGDLKAFYKTSGRTPFEVRKRYYDYHLSHRVGPLMTLPYGGGDTLDDLDYVMSHGQNSLFVGVPGWTVEAERPAEAVKLRAVRDLARSKGWSDSLLFYSRDEVAVMARAEIPQVVQMNNWTHAIVPDWPRLETSAPEQSLFGVVDVWCPTIDNFDPVVLAQRKARGDRLWFYTVWGRPGIMIEFPATDHRLMFWECWKYGAEGFLYWGTTHWDLNMSTDKRWPDIPWIATNRQPGHNGCGYLLYPGPNGTPLGSIRFELVRDGIEDYEYLWMLRDLLKKAGSRAPAKLRAQVAAELAIRPDVLVDNQTFTEDPQAILAARARIASLIERLRRVSAQ